MKITALIAVALSLCLKPAFAQDSTGEQRSSNLIALTENFIQPGGMFNVLTYNLLADTPLKNTGLKEAGLAAGPVILKSDEIRIFRDRSSMDAAPLARLWLNSAEGGSYWFHTGGDGSAEDYVIPKGAAVVVWTRASTAPISWNNVLK